MRKVARWLLKGALFVPCLLFVIGKTVIKNKKGSRQPDIIEKERMKDDMLVILNNGGKKCTTN